MNTSSGKMTPIHLHHFFPYLPLPRKLIINRSCLFSMLAVCMSSLKILKSHRYTRWLYFAYVKYMLHYYKATKKDFKDLHSHLTGSNRGSSGLEMIFSSSPLPPQLTTGLLSHFSNTSQITLFHFPWLPSFLTLLSKFHLCIDLNSEQLRPTCRQQYQQLKAKNIFVNHGRRRGWGR